MSDNSYNDFAPVGSALAALPADGSLVPSERGQLSELLPDSTVRAYTPLTSNVPTTQVADFTQTGNNAWTPDISPNQNYLYAVDQGSPALWTYSVNDAGALTNLQKVTLSYTPCVTENTTGAWSSDNAYYYVMATDGTNGYVLAFSVDGSGNATLIQTLTVGGNSSNYGQVLMHPNQDWMYATDTLNFNLQTLTRNPSTGMLSLNGSPTPTGVFPQYMNFDSTGHYLYVSNQDTNDNSINWYGINQTTGALIGSATTVQINCTSVAGTANDGDTFTDTTSGATGTVVGLPIPSGFNYLFVTIASGTVSPSDAITTSSGFTATVSTVVPAGNPFNGGQNPRQMFVRTYGGTDYLYWTNRTGNGYIGVASISSGVLTSVQLQATTDTGGGPGEGPAISPNGKWLYNCNFNSGTVDQFSINQTNGTLSVIAAAIQQDVASPNSLAVEPGNTYLAITSEATNIIEILSIDPISGALTIINLLAPSGGGSNGELPVFRSDGTVMYSAYNDSGDIYSFTLGSATVSPNSSLGKILGVSGGKAYVDGGLIQTFIAAENISANAPVTGAVSGQVKNQGALDFQIGTCFAAVTTGNLAIVVFPS